jgi:hypothetical protein
MYDDYWWTEVLRKLEPKNDELLRACLASVLFRGKTLRSLWKRIGNLDERTLRINRIADSINSQPSNFESRRHKLLEDMKVLLVIHKFKSYALRFGGKQTESILMVRSQGKLTPASQISTLIRSTSEAWMSDVHAHACVVETSPITADDLLEAFAARSRAASDQNLKGQKRKKGLSSGKGSPNRSRANKHR